MEHYRLDTYPIPKDKSPLYINEPWLIDASIMENSVDTREPEAQEDNFQMDVETIISQVEIYDQIWYVRHMSSERKHSREAVELVREVLVRLEEIPDGCAETFPYKSIDTLKDAYLPV